jgi:acylphosphatase
VEVVVEGPPDQLETLVKLLRRGPQGSWVEDVELERLPPTGNYDSFRIR